MRLFIDAPGTAPAEPFLGPLRRRPGPAFDEIEWPTGPGLPSLFCYRIPMAPSHSVIVGCCGNSFDRVLDELVRGPSETIYQELGGYWFHLGRLLRSGQEGDLTGRGLIRIVDPLDGVRKSFVGSHVEHTSRKGPQAKATRSAIVRVIEGAAACVAQAVEAAAIRPKVARLIAPPSDLRELARRLAGLADGFPLWDLAGRLERT